MPITLMLFIIPLATIGHFMIVTSYSILVSCAPNFLEKLRRKVKLICKWSNIHRSIFLLKKKTNKSKDNLEECSNDGESDRARNPEQYQHLIGYCNLPNTKHDNYGSI